MAEKLGADLDEVYYRVRKLERLGIVEVVRQEQRRGRPIKHYRAVARAFFVPFGVLPHETFERALQESGRAFEVQRAEGAARALARAFDDLHTWGFRVSIEPGGLVNAVWGPRIPDPRWGDASYMLAPERPAVYGLSTSLRLSRTEAKDLQHELDALMERWIARSRRTRGADEETGLAAYLLGVGMAPE